MIIYTKLFNGYSDISIMLSIVFSHVYTAEYWA